MTEPIALYVHWPFCKSKCPYCDFNSHVRASIDEARWRAALAHTEAAASAGPEVAPSVAAAETLAGIRARMRDDLDAPGALGLVDRWADRLLADAPTRITPADVAGARLVRDTADALLGISL